MQSPVIAALERRGGEGSIDGAVGAAGGDVGVDVDVDGDGLVFSSESSMRKSEGVGAEEVSIMRLGWGLASLCSERACMRE